jgi:hypothetical protein
VTTYRSPYVVKARLCGWHKLISGGAKNGQRECANTCVPGSIYCAEHRALTMKRIGVVGDIEVVA